MGFQNPTPPSLLDGRHKNQQVDGLPTIEKAEMCFDSGVTEPQSGGMRLRDPIIMGP